MSRNAKIVLATIVTIVIAAIVFASVWVVKSNGVNYTPESNGTQHAPQSPNDIPAMTREQADRFAANLVSQDTVSYRSAWAVDGELPPLAPEGTAMAVDLDTFIVTGNAATVNAAITLPGKAPVTCRLLMLYTTNEWRLVAMEEVK